MAFGRPLRDDPKTDGVLKSKFRLKLSASEQV